MRLDKFFERDRLHFGVLGIVQVFVQICLAIGAVILVESVLD